MAASPAVQREPIPAALAILVVVASAIALLRMVAVGRLTLLTPARDERWQAIDIAVVLAGAVLLGRPWLLVSVLPAAAGFAVFCLTDLARADQVRYLPKWGWAIACLIQIPLGGIMYLAAGKVPAVRPEPPALP